MAGHIPDAQSLTSWEDAFQHPLPIVRRLEQQLRKNIDENRQKLRSLVGASYRDLLGTADRIIEMDEQMQTVERDLGEIGRKCNASSIEKIAGNHHRMRRSGDEREREMYRAMAQTKVLQSALTVVSRTVKAGGDALLAAKLLVLSRLLHKSVSEGGHAPPVLEELRTKMVSLRRRVLAYIERALVKPAADKTLLAHTLCAYAIVTSSTPKEVLRHFLQVRHEQLENAPDSSNESEILNKLELYGQTLLDTRDLFPRRFSDTLSQLSKVALLQDEQVRPVLQLNLDIYECWFSSDLRTFTPWVRNEPFTNGEISDFLEAWTKQAQECLLGGIESYLSAQSEAKAVVQSRRKILQQYISLTGKLQGPTHLSGIDNIRLAFLNRLEELVVSAATISDLDLDEASVSNLVADHSKEKEGHLWTLAAKDLSLSNGALRFRQSVVQKSNGRSKSSQSEIEKLDHLVQRILAFADLIDEMRSYKWNDGLDFDLDDLSESEGDSLQHTLSKQDPAHLQTRLCDATQAALNGIIIRVMSSATETIHPAFYLRFWRETARRHRILKVRLNIPVGQPTLTYLHRNIARSVSQGAIDDYVRQQSKKASDRVPATTLWDGTPPLPTQPSPATFRFLKNLHHAMADAGTDLWSPSCVAELKNVVADELGVQLGGPAFTSIEPEDGEGGELVNGHAEDGDGENGLTNGTTPTTSSRKDQLVQLLFDVYYLRRIFSRSKHEKEKLDPGVLDVLIHTPRQHLDLDDSASERLKKSASDYWKKTYLLFGLLTVGGGEPRI